MKTADTHSTSYASYIVGFILSLVFTVIPYKLATGSSMPRDTLIIYVVLCALVQLIVQLKFFLHLDFSPKLRENLFSFIFTAVILLVFVFGSLWIMHDLNYFMMDPVMEQHHQMMGK